MQHNRVWCVCVCVCVCVCMHLYVQNDGSTTAKRAAVARAVDSDTQTDHDTSEATTQTDPVVVTNMYGESVVIVLTSPAVPRLSWPSSDLSGVQRMSKYLTGMYCTLSTSGRVRISSQS